MAVRFSAKRTFTAPATAYVPNMEGGCDEHQFRATFEVGDLDALMAESKVQALRTALVGWDGIEDESGSPLPFNEESRELVLRDFVLRQAIVDALISAAAGDPARKNSSTPRG